MGLEGSVREGTEGMRDRGRISESKAAEQKRGGRDGTYSVEPVVDEMFQVLAHTNLSHQLVLVAVHACQLTHMGKDVLHSISQLKQARKQNIAMHFLLLLIKFQQSIKIC